MDSLDTMEIPGLSRDPHIYNDTLGERMHTHDTLIITPTIPPGGGNQSIVLLILISQYSGTCTCMTLYLI